MRERDRRRCYNLVTKRWELVHSESKPVTAENIRADLRTLLGFPLLYKDDPRTRIRLGG